MSLYLLLLFHRSLSLYLPLAYLNIPGMHLLPIRLPTSPLTFLVHMLNLRLHPPLRLHKTLRLHLRLQPHVHPHYHQTLNCHHLPRSCQSFHLHQIHPLQPTVVVRFDPRHVLTTLLIPPSMPTPPHTFHPSILLHLVSSNPLMHLILSLIQWH